MKSNGYTRETVIAVAVIGFEANVKLAETVGEKLAEWGKLDGEVRDSYVELAAAVMENPEWGVERLHQEFMSIMRKHGWKHGELLHTGRKLHPAFKPFDLLTPGERGFYKVLRAVASACVKTGLQAPPFPFEEKALESEPEKVPPVGDAGKVKETEPEKVPPVGDAGKVKKG